MLITLHQVRAARGLLGWTQDDLAAHAKLEVSQVRRYERGESKTLDIMEAIHTAFDGEGIEFIPGGVRKRQAQIKAYDEAEGFRAFMDDVYETVKAQGGLVCVHNVLPGNWLKWLGPEWNAFHTARMQKIEKEYDFRITIRHGDDNLIGKHAEYRWLPERSWNDQSFYAYGDKLALMLFGEEDVNIRVVHSGQFAEGFRALFSLAWEHIPPIPNTPKKKK